MKSFIVYSGKGGVGKTTTSANIAKTLAAQGHKVFIIDADINTPSMGVIFGSEHPTDNLWVASTSFKYKNLIYMEKSMVRSFLRDCVKLIDGVKPDFLIIDTPPSITDIHINLLEVLKISAIVIVTQPNDLSRTDVNRTAMFFTEKCPDAGCVVIENMCEKEEPAKYSWPCIERIPFVEGFNGVKVYEQHADKYKNIVKFLEEMNPADVKLESQRRAIFDESITSDDLPYWDSDGRYSRGVSKSEIKFINLNTWEEIRDRLIDLDSTFGIPDQRLLNTDRERIERLIKPFEVDEEAYFMIITAPTTQIDLLPGEIGRASLFIDNSYYGLPRIKYHTKQGDVVLFPDEVKPATEEDIKITLEDGSTITPDGRYIPAKWVLEEVYNAFGSRVGMDSRWEALYDRVTKNLSSTPVESTSSNLKTKAEQKSSSRKERKSKKVMVKATISDGVSTWEEEFKVSDKHPTIAEEEIKEVIEHFNKTLKAGERERTFFKLGEK